MTIDEAQLMDRIIYTTRRSRRWFVGLVAADIFLSVFLRRFFSVQIPDSTISAACCSASDLLGDRGDLHRGGHITVDLVWVSASPRWKRRSTCFATLVLLFVVTVQTYTLFDKVHATYNDNVLTYDLGLPTWPFFAIAWAGDVSAVVLIAIRTWRLIFHPEPARRKPAAR